MSLADICSLIFLGQCRTIPTITYCTLLMKWSCLMVLYVQVLVFLRAILEYSHIWVQVIILPTVHRIHSGLGLLTTQQMAASFILWLMLMVLTSATYLQIPHYIRSTQEYSHITALTIMQLTVFLQIIELGL